jgi:hypothetical protein
MLLRGSVLLAATSYCVTAIALAQSEEAPGVFAGHREEICRASVVSREGFRFSCAAFAIGRRTPEHALEQARLVAIEQLVEAALVVESIAAERLAAQYQRVIRTLASRPQVFEVWQMQQVHTHVDAERAHIVLAVPETCLPGLRIDLESGIASVCDASVAANAPLALCLLAAEIATEDRRAAMTSNAVDRFGRVVWPDAAAWPAWVEGCDAEGLQGGWPLAEALARHNAGPNAQTFLVVLSAMRAAGYIACADAIARAHPPLELVASSRMADLSAEARRIDSSASPGLASWLAAMTRFAEQHPVNSEVVIGDAVFLAMESGQWVVALEQLVASPSRSPEWFRCSATVLAELSAPELAAVCVRIAATALPDDVACQLERLWSELATKQWSSARTLIEGLSARKDLTALQRAGLAKARRVLMLR